MKKIIVVLITIALFGFPATGFAYDKKIGVNAGLMFPMNNLGSDYDLGFTLGWHYLLPSSVTKELLWGLSGGVGRATGDYMKKNVKKGDLSVTGIELAPTVRYEVPWGDNLFFSQIGLGYQFLEFKKEYGDKSIADTDIRLGFSLGCGIDFAERFEVMAAFKHYRSEYQTIRLTFGYNF